MNDDVGKLLEELVYLCQQEYDGLREARDLDQATFTKADMIAALRDLIDAKTRLAQFKGGS